MPTGILRQWLIFFRAHTGILEAPIAAFGAAAAIGTIWSYEVALWALIGLMYHYAGYGQNSYYDWNNGYDKDDPNKQNHPLNTGAINSKSAEIAANGAVFITIIAAILTIGNLGLPLLLLFIAIVCGVIYNTVGKVFKHKYIFISVAHSLLFLIPYTLYTGNLDIFSITIFLALTTHHIYQIAISGDVKDIAREESSILSDLGIELSECGYMDSTTRSISVVMLLTIIQISLTVFAIMNIDALILIDMYAFILVSVLSSVLLFISTSIIAGGKYRRTERMKLISLRELVGFWLIYTALIPIIGIKAYVFSFVLCILYLIIHSRFMWGTIIRPEV